MALTGQVAGDDWTVSTQTFPVDGGFGCEVYVGHGGALGGEFKHRFGTRKSSRPSARRCSMACARAWYGSSSSARKRFICSRACKRGVLVAVVFCFNHFDG